MISCANHDFIEIACLYHLQLRVTLDDLSQTEGQAQTTKTSPDKKEYLVLSSTNHPLEVELEKIKSIRALTPNPHFQQIDF